MKNFEATFFGKKFYLLTKRFRMTSVMQHAYTTGHSWRQRYKETETDREKEIQREEDKKRYKEREKERQIKREREKERKKERETI